MKRISTVSEMQEISINNKKSGKRIGFVPTMGFLHEGHLQLVKKAREHNDIVVLSIFVNPLQFGPNEDFEAYPRDIERDEMLAKEAGVDYLFYPSVEEMYKEKRTSVIQVVERSNVLCGVNRVGHFDGVATVVIKLFNIVLPDKAYFGMKDAQQVAVLEGVIEDYNIPVAIERVPTVREEDGLAKSSRNVYLTNEERAEAPVLYQALHLGKQLLLEGKTTNFVKNSIKEMIEKETTGHIEYIEVLTYPDLKSKSRNDKELIIALAVKFSKARLIDNIVFTF
ncbi:MULTISPECIES: pantoate--beta-alanine ligase [Sutcliffiella]|uniref:Pantothenate synthetase n=1 Tax=Sutcliffiella cohnii TaxID=33932 RepID=A0A223KRV4_9BACI|nr:MULTISPECIES: pantoate--beta-alanine ligase [Sutcliffiella]AST92221.1 pantoate--beta-alanine ligase [Sutcliffiella cohnii]WBL13452.1 pantoate--beta-alanine ligase [Sutcliffiella sp. NC1]